MTRQAKTLIPADPDDLVCGTCPERFNFRGTAKRTWDAARAVGWHVLTELDGTHPTVKPLCPSCVGTPRTRIPTPPVLEGQSDILTELSVTITPTVKKRKKGREMS